jgi:hypothetical protein
MNVTFPIMPELRHSDPTLSGKLRKSENITTNGEYRSYLQKNAGSIMSFNKTMACQQVGPSFRTSESR